MKTHESPSDSLHEANGASPDSLGSDEGSGEWRLDRVERSIGEVGLSQTMNTMLKKPESGEVDPYAAPTGPHIADFYQSMFEGSDSKSFDPISLDIDSDMFVTQNDTPPPPLPSSFFDLLDSGTGTDTHQDPTDPYGFNAPVAKNTDINNVGRQNAAEQTYDIVVTPKEYGAKLSKVEILEMIELDHAVKEAPRLVEQINDKTRTNQVTYIDGQDIAIGTTTSSSYHRAQRKTVTEHEALNSTYKFLKNAASNSEVGERNNLLAASLMENLSYIGEKEYKEATEGIATYWRALLEKNPKQQVLAVAGEIAKVMDYKDEGGQVQVKSDDYLLDNILAHFTPEEVEKYAGRMITSIDDITVQDAADLKVILLDDWTISGSQLNTTGSIFKQQYPQFASSVEIQLIAASNERITGGLKRDSYGSSYSNSLPIPVRAYFKAHDAAPGASYQSGTHITGSHSSVDFDFENNIAYIAQAAQSSNFYGRSLKKLSVMPPTTNIVRPYRRWCTPNSKAAVRRCHESKEGLSYE